jgi:hypothetical protein
MILTRDVTARDLPEMRAELLHFYDDSVAGGGGDAIIAAYNPAGSISNSELFYVTEAMCDLSFQAAETLEEFPLHTHHFESKHGLIWFAQPLYYMGDIPVHFIAWGAGPDGVFLSSIMHTADIDRWIQSGVVHYDLFPPPNWGRSYSLASTTSFCAVVGCEVLWGDPLPRDKGWMEIGFWTRFASAILLMKQTLSDSTDVHPTRASIRRLNKVGAPVSAVRVINLRSIRDGSGTPEQQREWAHQWVVRGHWRMQPCGHNREERRPTWIAPHIKGPEGAPILGGDKVYNFTR